MVVRITKTRRKCFTYVMKNIGGFALPWTVMYERAYSDQIHLHNLIFTMSSSDGQHKRASFRTFLFLQFALFFLFFFMKKQ